MKQKRTLIYLSLIALVLAGLEGLGFYYGWMHSQFFFGEIAVLALVAGSVLGAGSWLMGKALRRDGDYYKNLREKPRLIEPRKEDWQ